MLKRSTPLKRTGFSRKPAMITGRPERAPDPLCRPSGFRVAEPVAQAPAAPVEKTAYVRSKKLREAYRLIPCQHCGCDDGTVCCAHSNWAEHGKGRSIKACDTRGGEQSLLPVPQRHRSGLAADEGRASCNLGIRSFEERESIACFGSLARGCAGAHV